MTKESECKMYDEIQFTSCSMNLECLYIAFNPLEKTPPFVAVFTPLNTCLDMIWFGNYIREMYGQYMLETSYLFNGLKEAISLGRV